MSDGIFGKFKSLVGIEEIEEEMDTELEEEEIERKPVETKSTYIPPSRDFQEPKDKVIPMQNKTLNAITAQFKIVVTEPKGFEECPKLVDNLKTRKPVIINLEKIETDTARKIFDFLSGATYALNGNVQKIANNIFVFLPENVDVSANTSQSNSDKNPWR